MIGWLFLVQLGVFFFFLYIRVPKASVPAVSCHGSMQGLNGPFPESLAIQLHSWLLMHSLTHTHTKTHQTPTHPHTPTHTHTHTHSLLGTFPCLRLRHTNMHLFSKSVTRSFHSSNNLTGSHQSSSETNKCVTCQQSIIGPF